MTPEPARERDVVERLAKDATEKRFALRLATEDQRNGYEVGWFEGYTAALEAKAPAEGEMVEKVAQALHEAACRGNYGLRSRELSSWPELYRENQRHLACAALASLPSPATDKMLVKAARALLAKIDADSAVRWKFVNEREGLRQALSSMQGRAG